MDYYVYLISNIFYSTYKMDDKKGLKKVNEGLLKVLRRVLSCNIFYRQDLEKFLHNWLEWWNYI